MKIKQINALKFNDEVYLVDDIVKIVYNGLVNTEVYVGRITSINKEDLWLDFSSQYYSKNKCIYLDNVIDIKSMEWRNK